MKAILEVSNFSAYAKYNGLTFEVKELLSNLVALDINGVTTDFNFKEVKIVDIQKELDSAYKEVEKKANYENTVLFKNLREYIKVRKINVEVDILV